MLDGAFSLYNDLLTTLGIGYDMLLNSADTQCLILCQPYCQPPGHPLAVVVESDNQLYMLYYLVPLPGGKRKSLYTCIIHFCLLSRYALYAKIFKSFISWKILLLFGINSYLCCKFLSDENLYRTDSKGVY